MKAWLSYGAAGLVVVIVGVVVAMLVVTPAAIPAIWFAAGLAFVLQLVAFAALVAVRGRNELFLLAWLSGLVLRFAAIGVVAFWLSRYPVFPREPVLIGLVAFLFVLLLMEPLFLRRGLQTR